VHWSALHWKWGNVAQLHCALIIALRTAHWTLHYALIIALSIVHWALHDALVIAFLSALRCAVIDLTCALKCSSGQVASLESSAMLIKVPDMAIDPRMARRVKDDEGKKHWKGEYMAQDFNGHGWVQRCGSVCKQEAFYYQWQPLPPGSEDTRGLGLPGPCQ